MPERNVAKQVEVLLAMANSMIAAKNYPQAKDSYLMAYRLDNTNDKVLRGLAFCAAVDRNWGDAARHLERIVALDKYAVEALKALGTTQFRQLKLFEEAIQTFRKLCKLDKNDIEAQECLGMALLAAGNAQSAEAVFSEVQEKQPENLPARLGLAVIAERRGQASDLDKILFGGTKEQRDSALMLLAALATDEGAFFSGLLEKLQQL